MYVRFRTYSYLVSVFFLTLSSPVLAVEWQEQAERLQKISATLLDGYPMGEPLRAQLGVEGKAIISFLPDVDPTVGGKSEKVPSSPVHAIPTAQVNGQIPLPADIHLGGQLWLGYLMPGTEQLVGIDASLSQSAFGFAAVPSLRLQQNLEGYVNLGYQQTSAKVKGAITAPNAKDEFSADNSFIYGAFGLIFLNADVWMSVLLGKKSTDSTFYIPSDHTRFKMHDALDDSQFGYVQQFSVGWYHPSGVQIGLAEVLVPARLLMPRLMLSYQYEIRK